jgi:hypothetical protein
MKVRINFVSNSSSTSFLFLVKGIDELEEALRKYYAEIFEIDGYDTVGMQLLTELCEEITYKMAYDATLYDDYNDLASDWFIELPNEIRRKMADGWKAWSLHICDTGDGGDMLEEAIRRTLKTKHGENYDLINEDEFARTGSKIV